MEEYLIEIYDRFSFDDILLILIKEGYDLEEALNFILNNCKLSTMVYQERIENKYYQKISLDETLSEDLKELKQDLFNKLFRNKN